MAKRKSEVTSLGLAMAAGLVYLAAGAAVTVGTFFTPHSFAQEAAAVRTQDGVVLSPFGHLPAIAHHVMVTGHAVLVTSLHYAFVPVHACIQLVSSIFGL